MPKKENITERTKYYLQAYLDTNRDVLEDSEIEELESLIKVYEDDKKDS